MPDFRPTLRVALASCLVVATSLYAQQIPDPANLTGEHVSPPALADTLPINHGAAALEQLLIKLRTRASMMLIVAHPDDEDGGFLTFESRGQGARVAMLTLNRGEGGQNLMSADFDDALGLIRTQELLAADRYLGVDQFFGTEVDFGFSKTKEEAFAKWTHDRVLYDAVRCVRLYRPLVIASVFVGGVTDGHGQHQVSGEIAQEVFTAAADPTVFPEMGLPPWAPLKVYARVPFSRVTAQGMFDYATGKWSPPVFHNYVTGKDIDHEPTATVTIHEGDKSTLIGMNGDSYVQFARKGLALQKSQNGGLGRGPGGPGGVADVSYTLMGSRVKTQKPTEDSVFDGIDTSLAGIATLAPDAPPAFGAVMQIIDMKIVEAQKAFDPAHLEETAEPLRLALQTLDTVISGTEGAKLEATEKFNLLHELRAKRVQLNSALVLALGAELTATAVPIANSANLVKSDDAGEGQPRIVPGGLVRTDVHFSVPATPGLETKAVLVDNLGRSLFEHPAADDPTRYVATFVVPTTAPSGQYFSRPELEQPFYDVSDSSLRNSPTAPPAFVAVARLSYRGVPLELQSVVAEPLPPGVPPQIAQALVPQAAEVFPALSLSFGPRVGLLNLASESSPHTTFFAVPHGDATPADGFKGNVVLTGQPELKITSHPPAGEFAFAKRGQQWELTFDVAAAGPVSGSHTYRLTAVAHSNGNTYLGWYKRVGYPGISFSTILHPAAVRAMEVNLATAPGLRVAYLPGTGDEVADYLKSFGIERYTDLRNQSDLTPQNLAKFDVVVLGVRAYAAHPWLAGAGSKPLLDFAAAGGVVLVQYNTAKYGDAEAPFPIAVPGDSAHNIVEEAQPVRIVNPAAPILSWPNKITVDDFHDWVAEFGHGFAASWAPQYTPVIEVHDPGQDPQEGGMLVAPVGKGAYIYCGLALYRQLPEGVPGAYRLFANLLSYAKNPGR